MNKNILAIGITILFLGSYITPSVAIDNVKKSSIPNSTGNTLYVGGSGPGNYTKIQDAIDDADDGDTVFVYNDSSPYYENISIIKSIRLIGEDRNSTKIVNEAEYVIQIGVLESVHDVTISGFTIENTKSNGTRAEGILIKKSSNTVISNNIIKNSGLGGAGIWILDSSYNDIHNNIIENTAGIELERCSDNVISRNFILGYIDGTHQHYGDCIALVGSCHNNMISDNNITSTRGGIGIGYYLDEEEFCSNTTISGNTIVHSENGITTSYGFNIKITGNIVVGGFCGIYPFLASNIDISHNIIAYADDSHHELDYGRGIHIQDVVKGVNTVYKNTITQCGMGILIDLSYNVMINNNNISNNAYGVSLIGAFKVKMLNNLITSNHICGIDFKYSLFNTVKKNNFINNSLDADFLTSHNRWVRNYWDDYSGIGFKLIKGELYFLIPNPNPYEPDWEVNLPWFNFDWHPAKEPYDIGV